MENAELLQAIQQMLRAEVEPIKERLTDLEVNMGQRLTKVEVTLENDIATKINLLYDGHQEIIRKLDKSLMRSDQIDSVTDRVSTLETVVKQHSDEINQLKKAN